MRKLLVVAINVALILCLMPTVNAYDDSMKVILCVDDPGEGESYEIGDTVQVKVYVFDKGELADADASPVVTLNHWVEEKKRVITVNKIDTGIYTGSFTILESDVDESEIQIDADATIGRDNDMDMSYDEDTDYNYIYLEDAGGEDLLEVKIEFDESNQPFIEASPGQTVEITIRVKYNDNSVNPDSLELSTEDYSSYEEEPLSHTNQGIGVFKASYTVSSTITESTTIRIAAEAHHNEESEEASSYIHINFFSIWLHTTSVTSTAAQFEICVADMGGIAIQGANVQFEYEIDWEEGGGELSGTTDSDGKVPFTINYQDAEDVSIDGNATYQGKTQEFYTSIEISEGESEPDIEEPSEYDNFEVIYQQNAGDIKPSTSVSLNYIAYEKAIILANQKIYYYIHTESNYIKGGSITTDSSGKFSISFTVPENTETVMIDFESPFEHEQGPGFGDSDDGFKYRNDQDYIDISYESEIGYGDADNSIKIETSKLKIGGETSVTVTRQNSEGFYGYMVIMPGEHSPDDPVPEEQPEWQPTTGFLYMRSFILSEDDKATMQITLPDFLPKDVTYTLMVLMMDPDTESYDYHWNYAHVEPGEEVTNGDDENPILDPLQEPIISPAGIDIPCLVFIIILLIVLIVIVVAVKRRV